MNYDIPSFKALVRRSWLTKNDNDINIFDNCYVFGLQSYSDKIITFHIMTDYGALRSRVPLCEIFHKEPIDDIPYHHKQLWNCFSEKSSIVTYQYLKDRRCKVLLKSKKEVWGRYQFTLDWFNNPYSDEPTDYKCAHIIFADDGYLLAMPNNRITEWHDTNFCVGSGETRTWKVDTWIPNVEHNSKWVGDDDSYFY